MGFMERQEADRVRTLLTQYQLPTSPDADITASMIIPHLSIDKKAVGGVVNYVLPERIGNVRIHSGIPEDLLIACLEGIRKE